MFLYATAPKAVTATNRATCCVQFPIRYGQLRYSWWVGSIREMSDRESAVGWFMFDRSPIEATTEHPVS